MARNRSIVVDEYHCYSLWRTKNKSIEQLKKELTRVSIQVLKDMVEDANGR